MLADLPVLAISGLSGSGKTTLIEAVLPALRRQGLAVAVVKHDVHGLDIDRPGKDSDRLFRAGADVTLQGPDETLVRRHADREPLTLTLVGLARRHDLVLVEGRRHSPLRKLWLCGKGEPPAESADVPGVVARLPWDGDRPRHLLDHLATWLPRQWSKRPLMAAVLIGGDSRRMGRPKHLIETAGRSWLERTVGLLEAMAVPAHIVGAGEVPATLSRYPRLPDTAVAGPLGGMLAAMRWAPDAAWLMLACDLPGLDGPALEWLRGQRRPGVWAIVPRTGAGRPEPLLACYEPQARPLLEALSCDGQVAAPRRIVAAPRCLSPCPPPELSHAWRNVNTPAEIASDRTGPA